MTESSEHAYLAEAVRTALALDRRVGALGLNVRIVSGRIVISGGVPSADCRDAVVVVAGELVGELEIVNETVAVGDGAAVAPSEVIR